MSVSKPTRAELFRLSGGNERVTRALEGLFDFDIQEAGTVTLDASNNATIVFSRPLRGDVRLLLTAWVSGGSAVSVSPVAYTIVSGEKTSVTIKGSAPNVNVDWLVV